MCFQGPEKNGPFDITGDIARAWLVLPKNPNGRPNSDVIRPRMNGLDLVRRSRDLWIIDFGPTRTEDQAAHYEHPFTHVRVNVRPLRARNRDASRRERWWLFGRTGGDVRNALEGLDRYIATPEVGKHRVFVWLPFIALPDKKLIVIARSDDTTFGLLHSRIHECWSLRTGGWHGAGNDPRYTPTTTFETFPFPEGLTPDIPAAQYADDPRAKAIAAAARELDRLRNNWLNPPEWVRREPEVVPGYQDRLIPVDEKAEKELKKRTLTHLYNERPRWLANAHRALDEAVAAAYGWSADLSEDELLAKLLALNLERAGK